MSLHATWAACAVTLARCLSASSPTVADIMFGAAREAGGLPADGWFRMPGGVGFARLGPQGADHRYRASAPDGLDGAGLPLAPAIPGGHLRREAEAFLRDARSLAAGETIHINGGRIPIAPSEAAMEAATGVVGTLTAALGLLDPAAKAALLRDLAIGFLRAFGRDGAAALDAMDAEVARLRAGCGADGAIWALARLRMWAAVPLVRQSPVPAVLYRLFDPFGAGGDPETALRAAVAALVDAGLGEAIAGLPDALLARAEAARDRALECRSVVAHGAALFEAAGDAQAAVLIAALLPGPRAAAGDIALRATHALVIDCINLGSGTALLRHQAQIATEGPAVADELIDTLWFYPRPLRATLLGPDGAVRER